MRQLKELKEALGMLDEETNKQLEDETTEEGGYQTASKDYSIDTNKMVQERTTSD